MIVHTIDSAPEASKPAISPREDGVNIHQDMSRSVSTDKQVSPAKLAHVVLRVRDLPRMRDWYRALLQADVTQESDVICFLTYDDEHHRIAFIAFPGLQGADGAMRTGLDHIAFTYGSLGDLLHTYERLRDAGVTPFWPINHGVTVSMYYKDPEGNRVELQTDVFASMPEAKAYMASEAFTSNPIGVTYDPEDLLRRFKSGEAPETLLGRPPLPAGKTPMDMLRV
jgi:catechol 2,3-dioxygenase-like lactoylglutathione lyase family enzyme